METIDFILSNIFSKTSFSLLLRDQNYLDPGSGSFVLQLIIAGALGIVFALKAYWKRIKSFFTQNDSEEEDDQDRENDQ